MPSLDTDGSFGPPPDACSNPQALADLADFFNGMDTSSPKQTSSASQAPPIASRQTNLTSQITFGTTPVEEEQQGISQAGIVLTTKQHVLDLLKLADTLDFATLSPQLMAQTAEPIPEL